MSFGRISLAGVFLNHQQGRILDIMHNQALNIKQEIKPKNNTKATIFGLIMHKTLVDVCVYIYIYIMLMLDHAI